MFQRSRYLANVKSERRRLVPLWVIAAFGLSMVVILVLLFPRQSLLEKLRALGSADPVALSYMGIVLDNEPKNHEMRLLLAERMVQAGMFEEAERALRPAWSAPDIDVRRRSLWVALRMEETRAWAAAPGTAERAERLARYRARVREMAQYPLAGEQLDQLIEKAAAIGDVASTARLIAQAETGVPPPEVTGLAAHLARLWLFLRMEETAAWATLPGTRERGEALERYRARVRQIAGLPLEGEQLEQLLEKAAAVGEQGALAALAQKSETQLARRAQPGSAEHVAGKWRLLQIEEMAAWAAPPDTAERAQGLARLKLRLREAAGLALAPAQTGQLAEKAARAGEPEVARRMMARYLASGAAPRTAAFLSAAAAQMLGAGDYRLASRLYLEARRLAGEPAQQRELFIKGIASLQAGNLMAEALQSAERELGELDSDREVLKFLTRLALAAGKPAVAERYANRLMRVSLLREAARYALLDELVRARPELAAEAARAAPWRLERVADARPAPFDDEAFRLSYDVYLANGNLAQALAVAESAVRRAPNHLEWRARLARVAEWAGKPQIALAQWRWLLERKGDQDAWEGVLRLAPGLFDDAALLAALERKFAAGAASESDHPLIADSFERLYRPRDGLAFFEARERLAPSRLNLVLIARLAQNLGEDARAIAALDAVVERYGPSPDLALQQAVLLFAKGDPAAAFERLRRARAATPESQVGFWQVYGELAALLQARDEALEAFQRALKGPNPRRETALEMLVELLRERNPLEAARLAEAAWREFKRPRMFAAAIDLMGRSGRQAQAARLLEALGPDDERALGGDVEFWMNRARIHQALRQFDRARRAWVTAAEIDPEGAESRLGLLWFLIERRDHAALRKYLRQWDAAARQEPDFAGAFAAAYTALGEPGRALAYFAAQLRARQDDYLWLMAYADALEQAREHALALRVRRHVWTHLRADPGGKGEAAREPLIARARLALLFAAADDRLVILRRVLRRDGAEPLARDPQDAAMKELVLAYALSAERHELAKLWLLKSYARQLERPVWAEAARALHEKDRDALARLLEEQAERLPVYDRIYAAQQVGRLRLAQTIAFTELGRTERDDQLHLQLTELSVPEASALVARLESRNIGPLRETALETSLAVALLPRLKLELHLDTTRMESRDASVLAGVPRSDRRIAASAVYRHDLGHTRLTVGARSALEDTLQLRLANTLQWGNRIATTAAIGLRQRAEDSAPLIAAGMKDTVSLALTYQLSKREYVALQFDWHRFLSQGGGTLGTGRSQSASFGHRLRTEYPDFALRASWGRLSTRADGSVDAAAARLVPAGTAAAASFFVPEGSTQWGLALGFGHAHKEHYSRAVRPFADVELTHNSLSGSGLNLLLGAGGSLLGGDHASVYWVRGKTRGALAAYQVFGLRYLYLFD